jgi:transposase
LCLILGVPAYKMGVPGQRIWCVCVDLGLTLGMFVRRKPNKSGVTSVQVIDKTTGRYRLVKTIGSSRDVNQVNQLVEQGNQWIKSQMGLRGFDFSGKRVQAEKMLDNIQQISVVGVNLLLGAIFDEIGFNRVEDLIFRKLVLARISYPYSKLKTTDMLTKYEYVQLDVQSVYRYMDKLYNQQKELVQQVAYQHTQRVLGGRIEMVFYDVTTLYFEVDQEDELRKTGFSKEGKHRNPQILLGLLVSNQGYPLAYEIFEGNKFEGETMLPVVQAFCAKYGISDIVIVADAGLLSKENMQSLHSSGYEFILGARLKNEPDTIRGQVLDLKLGNGSSTVIERTANTKLIVSYSDSRARKDKLNRDKGLERLEHQLKTNKLTKKNINNRGYNKYLNLKGDVTITIDYQKFQDDAKWDGLKGYITNSGMSKDQVIENYAQLWQIEKAFRINKHDLRVRPIFHRKYERIEAHICISFAAYMVYKELERKLRLAKAPFSAEKAIEIAKTIFSVHVAVPETTEVVSKVIITREDQRLLAHLFNF